jgi:hypothetical protein
MALDATIVRAKLKTASYNTADDVARSMITSATAAELKSLDVEAVLLLYNALYAGWYSAEDKAAMATLAAQTQFQPVTTPAYCVDLVRAAKKGSPVIQTYLTVDTVNRIYAAEKKRLSTSESWGFDGSTIGRGQLGQPAYADVIKPANFKAEFEICLAAVLIPKLLKTPGSVSNGLDIPGAKVAIPGQYSNVYKEPGLEDFVVAAYLALMFNLGAKAGRPLPDAARFGAARYHGMFDMVAAAQKTIGDTVNWAPVEAQLRGQGLTDQCNYVNEVIP